MADVEHARFQEDQPSPPRDIKLQSRNFINLAAYALNVVMAYSARAIRT